MIKFRRFVLYVPNKFDRNEVDQMKKIKNKIKNKLICILMLTLLVSCVSTLKKNTAHSEKTSTRKVAVSEEGNWMSYASDLASTKYSSLKQINKSNVNQLKVAWRWNSPDNDLLKVNPHLFVFYNEATPLAIDGYLYVSTAMSQVVKIDGATGKSVWTFDPKSYAEETPPNNGYVHRGVTYWREGEEERIFIGTGDAYLIALDAKTGQLIDSFGDHGRIDLLKGLNLDGSDWAIRWQYAVTSPVTVCQGVVIVGSSIMDGVSMPKGPRGDVRGYDARTGVLKWIFHTIPTDKEFGGATWKNGSNKYVGNTNVWTMMSADPDLLTGEKDANGTPMKGLVYLPVSTPTNDWYGGKREGDNLYAESIVCLSCLTGARKWHYQLVHHGLWDYDPPAAPNLVDIDVKGRRIKAVVQITKQGFAFAFDRTNGKPVWPIKEMPVPISSLEKTSPTQPIPSLPQVFDLQPPLYNPRKSLRQRQIDFKKNLIDLSPELNIWAQTVLDQYHYDSLYTPPTDKKKGTLILPGWLGGGNWAGAAYIPQTQVLYVSSLTKAWGAQLVKSIPDPNAGENTDPGYTSPFSSRNITDVDNKPLTLPLFKPPYGRISAIDMKTGKIKWQTPIGKGPKDHPMIKAAFENKKSEWADKDLGWALRTQMLATDELIFAGQQGEFVPIGAAPKLNAVRVAIIEKNDERVLKVLDAGTGQIITEIPLNVDPQGNAIEGVSGNTYGAPMTYLDSSGKQYIAVPVGGANMPAEIVAFALPD